MKSNIEEWQEVEDRLKLEKERRMYKRYQTIRLYLMGNSVHQITTIFRLTRAGHEARYFMALD